MLTARLAVAACAAVFPAVMVHAQRLTALRAGRLVDVDRGEIRRDHLVLVRGERIEAVQPGAARIPGGARVVDLSRYTVVPGLIDCHSHLIGDLQNSPLAPLERSGAQEALSGVRNARSTLLAVTSVRDIGTYRAFVDLALRDAIDDGTVVGPRMMVAGAYVTVASGAGEVTGWARSRLASTPTSWRLKATRSADLSSFSKVSFVMKGGTIYKSP